MAGESVLTRRGICHPLGSPARSQSSAAPLSAGPIRTVDLFAGAGGLSLGFEQAGFEVVAAYDWWQPAIECYEANFKHPIHEWDLQDVDMTVEHVREYKPDLIVGGPPCQDFSSAGKRTEGSNASLTEAFAEIAINCNPVAVVMENVPRAKSSWAWQGARELFHGGGYNCIEIVLDASYFGAPQIRKRVFCVAFRDIDPSNYLDLIESSMSSGQMTVAEYMGSELDFTDYYRHPRNYSRRAVYSIYEPSATIRGVNRPVPPSYPGHPLDTAPAHTVKPLTTYQRGRIQTFPKDWEWPKNGSKAKTEQLIGNAVPVELAHTIAIGLREIL